MINSLIGDCHRSMTQRMIVHNGAHSQSSS